MQHLQNQNSRPGLGLRGRGAHASIKPGVPRANRASPRIAVPKKAFQPAERATDLECGGKRSATPLRIDPMIQSAVVVPTSRDYAGALQKAVSRSAGSF